MSYPKLQTPAENAGDESARIQNRVRELTKAVSQSEIARRTGTPVSSVNRYLGQSRVPADFCAALVRGLGVNPAWLLTGEGATYLSDVTAGTADLAKGMLELVNSLVAVSRMRLGSLTGKHHLRVLRELNEALQTYHGLRDRLNAHSGPILKQLLDDLKRATDKQQFDVAHDLRNAAAQIAQFCLDEEQLRRFTAADATLEFARGNAPRALELSRQVFARTLTRTDVPSENALIQAHNLGASLCQNYRFKEAHRVCRLGLALAGADLQVLSAYHELRTLSGVVCVELGELATGVGEIMQAWPRTNPVYRAGSNGIAMRALLLCGAMSFAQAEAWAKDDIGRNRHLLRFALWQGDAAILARALDQCTGDSPSKVKPQMLESVAARLLLGRLQGKKPKRERVVQELADSTSSPIPGPVAAFLRAVYLAQLDLDKGDCLRADELLGPLTTEVSPDILTLAIHYRTAARAGDSALRARAQSWISTHQSKGYTFLAGVPESENDRRA
jgi:hypothetical protein